MTRATRSLTRVVLVAAFVLGLTTPITYNQVIAQSEQDTKKAILLAWKERQDRTETALFEWDQSNRKRLSSLLPAVVDHIRKEVPTVGEFIKVEQPSSLRLDKDKFDYRLDTIDSAKYNMPFGLRFSYNGKLSQNYSGTSSPGDVGSGIVQGDPHAFGTTMLYAGPLLIHYRPLHPTMSHIDINKYRVRTDKVPIGGHFCILLEEMAEKPLLVRFWLDPDNEFVLRRFEEVVEGHAVQRYDVSYSQDKSQGLVPTEWTTTTLITGTDDLNSAAKCKVRRYKINEPIPSGDFQIEFPAGTFVTDRVTGSTYRVGESGTENRRWLWVLSATLFLCFIAFLLFLRWRSKSRKI